MRTRRRLRLHPAAANAALLIGSLAVAVGASEIVARRLGPGQMPGGFGPALYRYDALLGWEKRPHAEVSRQTSEWDVTIATNALGMRGPEVRPERRPGVTRVLLLGDSFVEAYTVSQPETVSAQLENVLSESSGIAAEVLNGGTAGYSTDQELLFFKEHGAGWEPDVTVLFFYVNDLGYNGQQTYWRGAKPYYALTDEGLDLRGVPVPRGQWNSRELSDWLRRSSALYRLVRAAIARPRPSSDEPDQAASRSVPHEFLGWRRPGSRVADEAWTLTEALLMELRREAEEVGSTFVIFYVPSRAAIYDVVWTDTRALYGMSELEWSPTADADRLRDFCGRASLACLFPVERFRQRESSVDHPPALYFPLDGHWTADGHALAAQIIAEHLSARDVR